MLNSPPAPLLGSTAYIECCLMGPGRGSPVTPRSRFAGSQGPFPHLAEVRECTGWYRKAAVIHGPSTLEKPSPRLAVVLSLHARDPREIFRESRA